MGALKARSNLDRSLYRVPVAVQRTYLRMAKGLFYFAGTGVGLAALGIFLQLGLVANVGFAMVLFGAGFGAESWILIRMLKGKRLDVSDELITLDQGNGKVEIYPVAEIEHVKLIWIPHVFSRFVLHMKDGRKLSFNFALWERFDYVLDVVANAHPDMTSFPRYARFRNQCIAFEHFRSRASETMSLASFYELFAKAIAAPVIAGALIMTSKALGLGRDVFPADSWVFANTFISVSILWPMMMFLVEARLYWITMNRLSKDATDVRRDREAEAKFNHSYGIHSWFAFFVLIAMTCLMCAIRIH
ncbi:MAG: hypothetical protein AAB250_02010 [Bdellovibrionota bacterium]